MNVDDRAMMVACGVFGLLFGMVACGALLRWAYSIFTVLKESPRERAAWRWVVVAVLHSGPWMLAITGVIGWYVLSAPHARGWDVFFLGMAAAPLLCVIVATIATRRSRGNRSEPPLDPLRMSKEEKAQWVMRSALWGCLPLWAMLVAVAWEWVVKAPELAVVLGAAAYLASYGMGRVLAYIRYAEPWR